MSIQFDRRVSIGHVFSFASMLVLCAIAFASLQFSNSTQWERLQKVEARSDQYAERLRAVETAIAGQSSDLRNIQVGIAEIKAQLDRLTAR